MLINHLALKEEGLFRLSSEKFDYDRIRALYNKGMCIRFVKLMERCGEKS